jgi:hypothetical protein
LLANESIASLWDELALRSGESTLSRLRQCEHAGNNENKTIYRNLALALPENMEHLWGVLVTYTAAAEFYDRAFLKKFRASRSGNSILVQYGNNNAPEKSLWDVLEQRYIRASGRLAERRLTAIQFIDDPGELERFRRVAIALGNDSDEFDPDLDQLWNAIFLDAIEKQALRD